MNSAEAFPRDPVCGRKMNRNKAYAVVAYDRAEYLLCCPKCQAEFEANPELYVKGVSHPPRRAGR